MPTGWHQHFGAIIKRHPLPPIPVAAAEPLNSTLNRPTLSIQTRVSLSVSDRRIMEKLDDQSAAHYPPLTGDSGLKETLAKRLNEKYHANVDPERNILVIPGAELGLVAALTAFLQQGDELLVRDPSYASYFQAAQLLGAKAVSVPLRQETDFAGAVSDFTNRMTSKTKAAILAQPNNPTGTVFSSEFLSEFCTCVVEKVSAAFV